MSQPDLAPSYAVAVCPMIVDDRLLRLADVLGDLDAELTRWHLLEIETLASGEGIDVTDLGRRASAAPDGLSFSDPAMAALAAQLGQTINLDAFGYTGTALSVRLQARDSSDWLVAYARDVRLRGCLPWSITPVALTDPRALLGPD